MQEQLLERNNVESVGMRSDFFESIVIIVFLENDEPDFPTEIEGMKTVVQVTGENASAVKDFSVKIN